MGLGQVDEDNAASYTALNLRRSSYEQHHDDTPQAEPSQYETEHTRPCVFDILTTPSLKYRIQVELDGPL
jgi:hypothetical protein